MDNNRDYLKNNIETRNCRYGILSYFSRDNIIGRSLREYGEWAQAEIDFLSEFINKGDTIIDVGAFIGTHTISFSKLVGDKGKVYAFEPNIAAFELLECNIQQNSILNVVAFKVALSDHHGSISVPEKYLFPNDNPGSFSLKNITLNSNENSDLNKISISKLDDYLIEACDLIKIDVEGMESSVLNGATNIIKKFKPLVFAECLSIDSGWHSINIMQELGYEAFLHNELSYNIKNFNHNPINFLGYARETNIFFIPSRKLSKIKLKSTYFDRLIPIITIDDLALGLLKKPQYKYEILTTTKAAGVLGVDFIRNEPEIKVIDLDLQEKGKRVEELSRDVEERDRQIGELRAVLAEKTEQVDVMGKELAEKGKRVEELSRDVEERDRQIGELRAVLAEKDLRLSQLQIQIQQSITLRLQAKYQQVIEKLLRPGTRRRYYYELVLTGIRVILDEGWRSFWRKLLQNKKSHKKDHKKDHLINAILPKEGLINFSHLKGNIDSIVLKKQHVYGWGWLYDNESNIQEINFVVNFGGKEFYYKCQYGLNRPDVAKDYNCESSLYSGFLISCYLPKKVFSECFLEVKYPASKLRIKITPFVLSFTYNNSRLPILAKWVREGSKLIFQRRFKLLSEKITNKIKEAIRYNKVKNIEQANLLSIIKNNRNKNVKLIIDHNMGGGANLFRDQLIKSLVNKVDNTLLLYYDMPSLNYHLRIYNRLGEVLEEFKDSSIEKIANAIILVTPEEIFINNLVSFENPLYLLTIIKKIKKIINCKLKTAVHDFFMVCPSYTLINDKGTFCDIPIDLNICKNCLKTSTQDFTYFVDQNSTDIVTWRSRWSDLLNVSEEIVCFSESSKTLLLKAYSELDEKKVKVNPHKVDYLPRKLIKVNFSDGLHIGIVGKISMIKGAAIIKQIAENINKYNLPVKMTIIGEYEGEKLPSFVKITGKYEIRKLPDVITQCGANVFFFPSIWPETFSFVAEELMQLGLPLAAFNIGAPAERLMKYDQGKIIEKINADFALNKLIEFYNELSNQTPVTIINGGQ